MALATIAGCDKESSETGENGGGGNTPAVYVDLGLPSGTLWKSVNETNPNDKYNFYTYDKAVAAFGSKLPAKEQLEELIDNCVWTWNPTKKGYDVEGKNGNSIFLPAAGWCNYSADVLYRVGSYGIYWSSTPYGSEGAWYLKFDSVEVYMYYKPRYNGQSVRLVQD